MDFTSPNAFCALAITVFASCARALPHRDARQIAPTLSFLNTASPLVDHPLPVLDILYPLGLPWARDTMSPYNVPVQLLAEGGVISSRTLSEVKTKLGITL